MLKCLWDRTLILEIRFCVPSLPQILHCLEQIVFLCSPALCQKGLTALSYLPGMLFVFSDFFSRSPVLIAAT